MRQLLAASLAVAALAALTILVVALRAGAIRAPIVCQDDARRWYSDDQAYNRTLKMSNPAYFQAHCRGF